MTLPDQPKRPDRPDRPDPHGQPRPPRRPGPATPPGTRPTGSTSASNRKQAPLPEAPDDRPPSPLPAASRRPPTLADLPAAPGTTPPSGDARSPAPIRPTAADAHQSRPIYATDPDSLERDTDLETFSAGGPGGQHKNRTQTAVRLHHRPSGVRVIATSQRSLRDNRREAFLRLRERLDQLNHRPKPRRPTRPGKAAEARRLAEKRHRQQIKAGRRTGGRERAGDD